MSTATVPPLPELSTAATQVRSLMHDGIRSVRHPSQLTWWRTSVALMWLVGIAGDAYTTLAMMATGLYEEANGVAAAGMGALGPVGYTSAASALCAGMALVTTGRPRGLYAWTVWTLLALAGLAKLVTAVMNVVVWLS